MRKKLLPFCLVFVMVGLVVAIPALARSKSVEVDDNYFVSKSSHTISISRNTTVNWHWEGSNKHNVTLSKHPSGVHSFRSATKRSGVYAHKFTKAGTYTILCTIHAPGMKMTVKVR